MLTHEKIWTCIDRLAEKTGYSASGLAKKAGLDPTSFNKSKRRSPAGKPRWPSTESIAKILAVTDYRTGDFLALADDSADGRVYRAGDTVRVKTDAGGMVEGKIVS